MMRGILSTIFPYHFAVASFSLDQFPLKTLNVSQGHTKSTRDQRFTISGTRVRGQQFPSQHLVELGSNRFFYEIKSFVLTVWTCF